MSSGQFKLSKRDVYVTASIGLYWGWVLTIFYNPSFRATEFSPNLIGLWNIVAHIIALVACVIMARRLAPIAGRRVYVWLAAFLSALGTTLLFLGAGDHVPFIQLTGSALAGFGSAALLLGWGEVLGQVERDNQRRNLLSLAIVFAVSLYILGATLPPLFQVAVSMVAIAACGGTIYLSSKEARRKPLDRPRAALAGRARKSAALKWWSMLLCTFFFSIPLVYFRVGESNGVRLSIFSSMLLCLCVIFLIDFLLRKRFNQNVMPSLFVLLTSGGMILMPFLVQGDVFLVGLLIHTGGFAFRAFIYPEFVKIAAYLEKPSAVFCAVGTVAIDLGQVMGTFMRSNLSIQSDQWFVHTTLGIAYALFLAAFLFFTHRFDVEADGRGRALAIAGIGGVAGMGGQGSVDGAEDVGQGGTDASVHPMIAGIERSCDLVASTFGLSAKECEILKLIARGRSGASIAEEMVVSLNTIKTHVTHIYRKCGVHSREELLKLIESVNAA